MATKSTTAVGDGQRVFALWVLWLALFLLLAAAGVAIVGGVTDDPVRPEPPPLPPTRTGALEPSPTSVPGGPASLATPMRRVALDLRRAVPGGGAPVPYLGPVSVTSLDGGLLTARAGVPMPTPATFLIEATHRRAVVRASGFQARTFAVDDHVAVVLEPDATVRLRVQGLPAAGGLVQCAVAEDGVVFARCAVEASESSAEVVVAVGSGRNVDLSVDLCGHGLTAQWHSPRLQLRAGEVRTVPVDLAELPVTLLQVRGPSNGLLAGMVVAIEREGRPWVRVGETVLDGDHHLVLRGMTGDRLRAFAVGSEAVPLLPIGAATPVFACDNGAVVVVQPARALIALRLEHAGRDQPFTLRATHLELPEARRLQVLPADLVAAHELGELVVWSPATGGLRADVRSAAWAGDVGTLHAAAAERTGTLRVTIAGAPPWWVAQLRLRVVEVATGKTDELPIAAAPGGGEVLVADLRRGRHALSWLVLGQACAPIAAALPIDIGEQTLTTSWPEIDVWIGEIVDWSTRDSVRAAVAVEVAGTDGGTGSRVWTDAAGTFRLLRPRGAAGMPALALARGRTAAVPLRVEGVDAANKRLRVRVEPTVHWVHVRIGDHGFVEWYAPGDVRCRWRSRGEDRVPVPAGGRLWGVLRTPVRGPTAFVTADESVAALEIAPRGHLVAVTVESATPVRLHLLGPVGLPPVPVGEFAGVVRHELFVPDGTTALRVENAGVVRDLTIADAITIR